jgi:hypothetical protein
VSEEPESLNSVNRDECSSCAIAAEKQGRNLERTEPGVMRAFFPVLACGSCLLVAWPPTALAGPPPPAPIRISRPALSDWTTGHWRRANSVHEGDCARVAITVQTVHLPPGEQDPGWTTPSVKVVLYTRATNVTLDARRDELYSQAMTRARLRRDMDLYSATINVAETRAWLGSHYADVSFRSSRGEHIDVPLQPTLRVLPPRRRSSPRSRESPCAWSSHRPAAGVLKAELL